MKTVIEYGELEGVTTSGEVKIPILRALALQMLSTDSDLILIPAINFDGYEHIEKVIGQFPDEYIKYINVVDKDKRIFSRVYEYLRPIGQEASNLTWPENQIAMSALRTFYPIAIATVNGAQVLSDDINSLREFLLICTSSRFSDEAKFRLSQIFRVVSAYQPYHGEILGPPAEIPIQPVGQLLLDYIDDAEIAKVRRERGLIGHIQDPMPILRKTGQTLRNWFNKHKIKKALDITATAIETTGSLTANPAGIVSAEVIKTLPSFIESISGIQNTNGPIIRREFDFRYKAAQFALREYGQKATWPQGTIYSEKFRLGPYESHHWLSDSEEDKNKVRDSSYSQKWLEKSIDDINRLRQGILGQDSKSFKVK